MTEKIQELPIYYLETTKKAFLLLFLLTIASGFNARQVPGNRESTFNLNTVQHEDLQDLNPHIKIEIHMATEEYTKEDISYPIKDEICPIEDRMCFTGEEYKAESEVHPLASKMKEGRKETLIIDVRISINGRQFILSVPVGTNYDNRRQEMVQGESSLDFLEITPIDYNELRNRALRESCVNTDEPLSNSLYGDTHFPVEELQNCIHQAFYTGLKPICEHERELKQFLEYYEGKEGFENIVRAVKGELLFNNENKYALASELFTIADNFDKICKAINIENRTYEEANGSPVCGKMEGIVELAAYNGDPWRSIEEIKKHNIAPSSNVCAFTLPLMRKSARSVQLIFLEVKNRNNSKPSHQD